jgi:hypothetical protein
VVVVGEVADDFGVAATAVVGVAEVVECVGAGWAVGVGRAVDVDVHAMREKGEVLRGRRRALRSGGWEQRKEGGEREGAEMQRQKAETPSRC